MRYIFLAIAALGGLIWWMLNGEARNVDEILSHHAVDDLSELLARTSEDVDAQIDPDVSSDGNGSLRIEASAPVLLDLYEVWGEGIDLGFRQLVYQARLRTEDASGPVFLVMQAGVTGAPEGQMPVIGSEGAIEGTHEWTTLEIVAGNPAGTKHLTTKLQLQVGPGTVWIDDIKLIRRQKV